MIMTLAVLLTSADPASGGSATAAPAAGASASPAARPTVPPDAAVIVNSGSTNVVGYRIVVRPDRSASIAIGSGAAQGKTLSAAATQALFKDLAAAAPVDALEHEPCMKSVSFGSTTTIEYKGRRSPDLSCSSGNKAERVSADIATIVGELGADAVPRMGGRSIHPLPEPSATP